MGKKSKIDATARWHIDVCQYLKKQPSAEYWQSIMDRTMFAQVQVGTADILRIKRQLANERDTLASEINAELACDDDAREQLHMIDCVRDRGDDAVADLYSDLALSSIQGHVDRLQTIESALYRINKNVYGVCLDCANPIDKARLDADPAVTRCFECQTRMESTPGAKDVMPSL